MLQIEVSFFFSVYIIQQRAIFHLRLNFYHLFIHFLPEIGVDEISLYFIIHLITKKKKKL